MNSFLVRWAVLLSFTIPFLTIPMMSCDNAGGGGDVGTACTTDEDCEEGTICIDGECEDDSDNGCDNFFSCEVNSDCEDFGFSQCIDGCCED